MALREQYQEHIRQMQRLAYSFTNMIDRAIYDGLQGGLKKGLQSLGLSVLDFIKNIFLTQLQNAIAKALGGISPGAGGGKGGFFSGLFGAILGGIGLGGLAGGGGTGASGGLGGGLAGSFASGGNIPMGQYGIVHDNERVFATPMGAFVQPSHGGHSENTVINIHVPVRSAGSYSSPRSRRQLAEDIASALQGATT
jgi:hypothetical protein